MSSLTWTLEEEKAGFPLLGEVNRLPAPTRRQPTRRQPTRRQCNGRWAERGLFLGVVVLILLHSGSTGSRRPSSTTASSPPLQHDCSRPYSLPGVLRVSLDPSTRHLNAWEPSLSPCRPTDFLTPLFSAGPRSPSLEFLQNKTVVLFGDSVDRGFVQHLCVWAREREETVDEESPLKPPYPEGREYPPDGYRTHLSRLPAGESDLFWPAVPFGQPHICHLRKYNFRVVSVFQFGVDDEDEWLTKMNHFYPPGGLEDRFDQILLPLLENIAHERSEKEGRPVSPIPDLLSFTSTFWTPFRHVRTLHNSTTAAEWEKKLGTWAPPTSDFQHWFERRWAQAVRHIGDAWAGRGKKPKLVFRELQQILARDDIPSNHVELALSSGRRAVDLLRSESSAARAGLAEWEAWKGFEAELGEAWEQSGREAAKERDLGRRVEVLEWGRRFMGQQVKFTDDGPAGVHPHPLPGSWLFWNMLLDVLQRRVAEEERAL